jgi:hypothetical protein
MADEPYSHLTDERIRKLDTLTAHGPDGKYFAQFIPLMAHGRAPLVGPHEVQSCDIEIEPDLLGQLAARVKTIRGGIDPEAAKYLA